MKNTLKVLALTLLAMLLPALSFAQQNFIVQTTLSAALAVPSSTGSTAPLPYSTVQIASATGITGYSLNTTSTLNVQSLWVLYIDHEEMAIIQSSGTTLQVIRGYNSTVATSHVAGTMVLYGKALWFYNFNPGVVLDQGGTDSVSGGTACVLAQVLSHPWVNVRTGQQWICSTDTLSWVEGFNNAFGAGGNNVPSAGTLASAAGTNAVLGPVFRISGTQAIVTFTPPVGFNNTALGGGCFTVIPSGVFTWTAAGNISVAGTVTAANLQVVTFCWNPYTSKWMPSRVA